MPHSLRFWSLSLTTIAAAGPGWWAIQQVSPPTRPLAISKEATLSVPVGWEARERRQPNVLEIFVREALPGKPGEFRQSRVVVITEDRKSFEDCKKRLAEIAAEVPSSPPQFLAISGWPALIRHYKVPQERRGGEGGKQEEQTFQGEAPLTQRVTTAIAAGIKLFRLEASLAPGASPKLAQQAELVGRSLKVQPPAESLQPGITQTLEKLRAQFPPQQPKTKQDGGVAERPGISGVRGPETNVNTLGGGSALNPTTPVLVHQTRGELAVAVSNDGSNVVIATNGATNVNSPGSYSFSNDGGQNFTAGTSAFAGFPHDGDPSLAIGASGTVYLAFLGNPDGTPAANNVTGCSASVDFSSNNGSTFTFRSHAVFCPNGMNACGPDQEHIAADRVNAATAGDQVYMVWRNFTPNRASATTQCANFDGTAAPSIVCSTDSGQNWAHLQNLGTGDFPRVALGSDGFVYVVFRQNANVVLDKFSSCADGLTLQQGWPVTVDSVNDVVCPVPGLDRCNDGNRLSSHMVAVDTNTAAHVYAAFASNNGAGEDIIMRDSVDGGATFPRRVVANGGPPSARRFLPWICPVDDTAFISWYDRRKASQVIGTDVACTANCKKSEKDCEDAGFRLGWCIQSYRECTSKCIKLSTNDLTEYFYGLVRPQDGVLESLGESDLSGKPDPQCASAWTDARSAADFQSCSIPPQNVNVNPTTGGLPKYGDYNGNACAPGRAYFAWASATAPDGLPAVSGINVFFAATPPPATLTIQKIVSPSSSSGHFFLTLDGAVHSGSVADQGSTGPLTVLPILHVVGEDQAGDASLINFSTVIGGDCAADGSITLNSGDNKTCTITNTRVPKTVCLKECKDLRDACIAQVGSPGGLRMGQCIEAYNQCQKRCEQP